MCEVVAVGDLVVGAATERQVARLALKIRDPKARADVEEIYTFWPVLAGNPVIHLITFRFLIWRNSCSRVLQRSGSSRTPSPIADAKPSGGAFDVADADWTGC